MSPQQRWIILGCLLGTTLLAGYLVDNEAIPDVPKGKVSAAGPPAATTKARRTPAPAKEEDVDSLSPSFPEPAVHNGESERKVIDPFRSHSWNIAQPPPPLPKPIAPPLPFQYLGKLKEDDVVRVFLDQQGKHIIVKVGDVIDGEYSVEEIAGGRMTMRYLPLNEPQMLAIGSDTEN